MPKYADQKGGVNIMRTETAPAKRGRPRAQYKCAVSGRVCPFNDAVWEYGDARAYAQGYCPVHRYEASDDDTGEIGVLNDYCRHLLERKS